MLFALSGIGNAQTPVYLGETRSLGYLDSGNANLLVVRI